MKIHISFNIHIFSQIRKNHIFPLKIHNSTTSYSIRVGNSKWDPFSWFWNTMLRSSSYISTMPDTEWMREQQKNKIVLWLFFQKKKWLAPKRRFFIQVPLDCWSNPLHLDWQKITSFGEVWVWEVQLKLEFWKKKW